jgi:hypothetical protein
MTRRNNSRWPSPYLPRIVDVFVVLLSIRISARIAPISWLSNRWSPAFRRRTTSHAC